jgi:hypothetical protein
MEQTTYMVLEDVRIENGPNPGQNQALTGLFVPSSLDSGPSHPAASTIPQVVSRRVRPTVGAQDLPTGVPRL